eukprot:SAG31_NODE_3781_length_3885_cov_3.963286_3_plen_111_part_00
MPPRGRDEALEDDNLAITVDVQHDEAMSFNYGLPMPAHAGDDPLMGDSDDEDGFDGSDDGEAHSAHQLVAIQLDGRRVHVPLPFLLRLLGSGQVDGQVEGDSDEENDSSV